MSSKGALRWAIVGAGKISHDWAVAVSTLPPGEHEMVGVAARNVDHAKSFASTHGIPKVYQTYEELAKDPETDVVYVGIIHPEHLRVCKMVLDHGKHILCEKPLCMNVRETKELLEYATSKKLFLMEAMWSRFFPAYQRLREEIDKGTIGDVIQVRAEMGLHYPEDNWRRDKEVGGGTVLDMGTYTIHFAMVCFKGQRPEKILASGHLNKTGSDDSTSATLIYPGGKTATLITHCKINLPCEAIIAGTKGMMKLPFPFWAADKLEMPDGKVLEFPLPKSEMKINFWNSTGLAYQCNEVKKCITEGLIESPNMSFDDSILLAEIRESIRKQAGVVYPQD